MTRAPRPSDARPTAEIVRHLLKRDQAHWYRRAADDLYRLADQLEREARDEGEVANIVADADDQLTRRPRRMRA